MNKQVSPKIIALTFGILVISFSIAFYVVAWQEPTEAPPGGNVPTPLNVGPEGQSKAGGLILNTGGAEYGLIIDQGKSQFGGSLIFNPISRPTAPMAGQVYFDQTDQNMYYYDGAEWVMIGKESIPTCGTCQTYDSQTGGCVNLPSGTKDENCSTLHYACDGAGNCTAPKSESGCLTCTAAGEVGKTFNTICTNRGYDGCVNAWDVFGWCYGENVKGCNSTCSKGTTDDGFSWSPFQCFSWVYD